MEDFLQGCWKVILDYWFLVLTLIMTILMAALRTAKQYGKVDWIEAVICGIFALSVWLILGWFNIPESAGVLIGGMIGFKGSHAVSDWLSEKFGVDEDEENK